MTPDALLIMGEAEVSLHATQVGLQSPKPLQVFSSHYTLTSTSSLIKETIHHKCINAAVCKSNACFFSDCQVYGSFKYDISRNKV